MDLREQIQSTLGDAYTVERELGGGGMSRVFVAIESALGRRIVVKILPPDALAQVSTDRFKREVRLAATLQHPHIVPLLAAGDTDGLPYYTMPFVKGESLRERLVKGGELSISDAVHVLHDVASALAYAHGEGVVHRDIKPDNIILSGGVAVVADFGVAKALDVATTHDGGDKSALTSLGVALGTPAYMSPEQASADPQVDHRADIYSFGCVAYEMLAGASPFAGRPLAQMLAAQVQEQPEPISKRRSAVSPALAALIMKCLEKRPGDRPQSASELLAALDAIGTPTGGSEPTGVRLPAVRTTRRRIPLIVAAVVLIAGGCSVAAWFVRGGRMTPIRPGRVTSVATSSALEMSPAISPDGKFVAFMAGSPGTYHIHVRQIAGERSVDVSAELGGEHANPVWSPDGSQIAFLANNAAYAVPATGGSPKLLVETEGSAITDEAWSPDGSRIAFASSKGISVKQATGGDARVIVGGELANSIAWSPDGTRIAYVDGIAARLDNLSAAPIRIVDVATGKVTAITPNDVANLSPVWAADGKSVLYLSNRDGPLDIYQQFVGRDAAPRGVALRITTGLSARRISLSADGTRIAYDVVRNRSNIWVTDFPSGAAVASTATARQITSDNQRIESLTLSHDGRWLAYDSDRGGNSDVYKIKVDGGEPVQLTTNPGNDFSPEWSHDDRRLVFHSSRTGRRQIYSISADGNDEQQLTNAPMDLFGPELSPDGKHLVAFAAPTEQQGLYDVEFDLDAIGRWANMHRVTPTDQTAIWARISSDGKWLGYVTGLSASSRFAEGATARASTLEGRDDHLLFDLQPRELVSYVTFGPDPNTAFVMTRNASSQYSIYSVPVTGGTPRLLLRDDPAHRISRWEFVTDGRKLFFTLAADESDVYVMQVNR